MARSALKYLDLEGNDLESLPPELGLCKSLSRIRLQSNPMRKMQKLLQGCEGDKLREYLINKIPQNHYYYNGYQEHKQENSLQQKNQSRASRGYEHVENQEYQLQYEIAKSKIEPKQRVNHLRAIQFCDIPQAELDLAQLSQNYDYVTDLKMQNINIEQE